MHRLRGHDKPDPNATLPTATHYDDSKETQYFYGTPSQEKLFYLFGNEVGDAAHYKKNMVTRP